MSAIIDEIVAYIRGSRYGRDVRESIAQGIETIDDVAEGARDSATASASDASQSAHDAEQSASNALTSENNASASATTATQKATLSESWAVGGTDTRAGEDTNNAKYWAEQAQGSVAGVASFNGRTGVVTPTSGDYDITQISVDNQTAGKVAVSDGSGHMVMVATGQSNGIASLDENGRVPSSQLPSYVDDVLEYNSVSAFPVTGEGGKIYVALDSNKTYRWSGSAYIEISESIALGETTGTAYEGSKGKANADAISALQTTVGGLSQVEANPSGSASTDLTKLRIDEIVYDIQGGHIIRNSSGTALAQRKSMQFDNCTVTDDSTNNKTIVKPDAPLIIEKTYAEYLADKTALDASGNLIKITDMGLTNSAAGVSYDKTIVNLLLAGNVQGAIDELASKLVTHFIKNHVATPSMTVSNGLFECIVSNYVPTTGYSPLGIIGYELSRREHCAISGIIIDNGQIKIQGYNSGSATTTGGYVDVLEVKL